MKCTYIFGHLESTHLKVGQEVNMGDPLGVMGNSGVGTGAHLHLGCVEGDQSEVFRLGEQWGKDRKFIPALEQCVWAVEGLELWKTCKSRMTTAIYPLPYFEKWGKWHAGYDVVPADSDHNLKMHWPRSTKGVVRYAGVDPLGKDHGYGLLLLISFDI